MDAANDDGREMKMVADGPQEELDDNTGLPADIAQGLRELGLDNQEDWSSDEEEDNDVTLAGGSFANEQNKELDRQVKIQAKILREYEEKIEENTTRVGIMMDHLKNVKQELLHTQSLVDTKAKEIETEAHLRRMAEIDISRLEVLEKDSKKVIGKLQETMYQIQSEQFASHQKLEEFRMQMNWNQEELLQWSLAAKQKEEDRLAVEKYKHEDNKKIKHLTMTKQKATEEMNKKKESLENEVTETRAIQIELNKTADEYRKMHLDRQELIKQWDDAVQAQQKRDEDIKAAKEAVAEAQKNLRAKQSVLRKQKKFLENEQNNNSQVELQIEAAQRQVEKSRQEMQRAKAQLSELENKVEALQNENLQAEIDVKKAAAECRKLEEEGELKQSQLAKLVDSLEEKKHEMKLFQEKAEDMVERANQVERMHSQYEDLLNKTTKELDALKQNLFKENKRLTDGETQKKHKEVEIHSAQKASKALQAKIRKLDTLTLKQQEMLYNTEFNVQQLERKVDRASGKRSFEETETLNKMIKELQEALEIQDRARRHMVQQVKRLATEVKTAEKKSQSLNDERGKMKEKLHNVELKTESMEIELKEGIKTTRQLTMEHDVLKLEVSKLRQKMAAKSKDIFALRTRKMEIELQMKTRKEELQLFEEIQKGEIKAAEDARHQITMDLKERQLKAQKLKQKYDTVHAKLIKPGEEDRTQAYYIIKVAQEREELQNKGDKLNDEIKTAEKDIRMLAKALVKMNRRNDKYKSLLYKADVGGADFELKEKLEEQHRSVSDALYTKKNHLKDVRMENDENKQVLTKTVNELARMQNVMKSEIKEKSMLDKQLTQQEAQKERLVSELDTVSTQMQKTFSSKKGVDEYVDYLYLKQKNRLMLEIFANLVHDFPLFRQDGLQNIIAQTLSTAGVPLPSKPVSRASTRSRPPTDYKGRAPESKLPSVVSPGSGFASSRSSRRPQSGFKGSSRGSTRNSMRNSRPTTGNSKAMQ